MSGTMVTVLSGNPAPGRRTDPHAHHRQNAIARLRAARQARRRALASRLRLLVPARPRPWLVQPDPEVG